MSNLSVMESLMINELDQYECEQIIFKKMYNYNTELVLKEEFNMNKLVGIISEVINSFIEFLDAAIHTFTNTMINNAQVLENKKLLKQYKDLNIVEFDKLKPTRILPNKFKEYEKKYNDCITYIKVSENDESCMNKINQIFGININNIDKYRKEVRLTLYPNTSTGKSELRKIVNSNIDEYEILLKDMTIKAKNTRNSLMDYRSDLRKEKMKLDRSLRSVDDKETIEMIKKTQKLFTMRFSVARTLISTHIVLCEELRTEIVRIFKEIIRVSDKDREKV